MYQNATLNDLREGVITEMVNRSYSSGAIRQFSYNCSRH